jgi:hypothetical protein
MESLDLNIDPCGQNVSIYSEEEVFGSAVGDRSCADDFCEDFVGELQRSGEEDFILATSYGYYKVKTAGYSYLRYVSRLS